MSPHAKTAPAPETTGVYWVARNLYYHKGLAGGGTSRPVTTMQIYLSWNGILNAVVFTLTALAVFALAFRIATGALLPRYRDEIVEKQNLAAAVLVGLVAVALAIIVAAAFH